MSFIAVELDGLGISAEAWEKPGRLSRRAAGFVSGILRDTVRVLDPHVDAIILRDATAPLLSGGADDTRPDAALLLSSAAGSTRRAVLVPQIDPRATEPFHVSRTIATLSHLTEGRAGILLAAAAPAEHAVPGAQESEYVQALRALWASWDEDAIIRDVPAGRFLDAEKVRPVHFRGDFYSVRGPSPTPRPTADPRVFAEVRAASDVGFARDADAVGIVRATDVGAARALAAPLVQRQGHSAAPSALIAVRIDIGPRPEGAVTADALPLAYRGGEETAQELESLRLETGADGWVLSLSRTSADAAALVGEIIPRLRERSAS